MISIVFGIPFLLISRSEQQQDIPTIVFPFRRIVPPAVHGSPLWFLQSTKKESRDARPLGGASELNKYLSGRGKTASDSPALPQHSKSEADERPIRNWLTNYKSLPNRGHIPRHMDYRFNMLVPLWLQKCLGSRSAKQIAFKGHIAGWVDRVGIKRRIPWGIRVWDSTFYH